MKFIQGGRYLIVVNERAVEVWDLGIPGGEWKHGLTPTRIGMVGTENKDETFYKLSNVMWVADGIEEKQVVRFATSRLGFPDRWDHE